MSATRTAEMTTCDRAGPLGAAPAVISAGPVYAPTDSVGIPSAVRAVLSHVGVTRMANVTHLDRIGIPVVTAVRPNARSISIAMGKGLTQAEAETSAAMEAIEGFHAETTQPALTGARYTELPPAQRLRTIDRLQVGKTRRFDADVPLDWAEGVDLISGRCVLVPFDLVHTDYTRPAGGGGFQPGSNGLASGRNQRQALIAAISETIERDAVARWLSGTSVQRQRCLIDLGSVTDPRSREAIARLRQAAMTVSCWDVTSEIGVPAFACRLLDDAEDGTDAIGPVRGSGCHPRPEVALLRALTEAAQIRLTYIVGARDDLDPYEYATGEDRRIVARAEEILSAGLPRMAVSVGCGPAAETLHDLLDRLKTAGLKEVIAVDLTRDDFRLPVVRAIIPGMIG